MQMDDSELMTVGALYEEAEVHPTACLPDDTVEQVPGEGQWYVILYPDEEEMMGDVAEGEVDEVLTDHVEFTAGTHVELLANDSEFSPCYIRVQDPHGASIKVHVPDDAEAE